MGILDIVENPAGVKFGAKRAHRGVLVHPGERGVVAIMGANGMFYTNNVGAFGVSHSGRNLGRLGISIHRVAMSLRGVLNVSCYYSPTKH